MLFGWEFKGHDQFVSSEMEIPNVAVGECWYNGVLSLAFANTVWHLQYSVNEKKHGKTSNPTLLIASKCTHYYLLPLNKVRLRTESLTYILPTVIMNQHNHNPQPSSAHCRELPPSPCLIKSWYTSTSVATSFPSPLMFHVMMAGEERYVIM